MDRHGPLQDAPPPYDSVFYSVFRVAASHVVFLQDRISPWSGPPCAVASTVADSGHSLCLLWIRGKTRVTFKV